MAIGSSSFANETTTPFPWVPNQFLDSSLSGKDKYVDGGIKWMKSLPKISNQPACNFQYRVTKNSSNSYTARITVQNKSGSAKRPHLTLALPGSQNFIRANWGAVTERANTVEIKKTGSVGKSQSNTFVYQVSGSANQQPVFVKLDNQTCAKKFAGPAANKARTCDIYAAGGTKCIAAHSSTRALYKNYYGRMYDLVRDANDSERKYNKFAASRVLTIFPKTRGGVADVAAHDAFCKGAKTCEILRVYDQSNNSNNMERFLGSTPRTPMPTWNNLSDANAAPVMVDGSKAYGIFFEKGQGGYRRLITQNVPKNADHYGIYAIFDARHYSGPCCMGYGIAQTDGKNNGPGTMETLYYGDTARENDKPVAFKDGKGFSVAWSWGKGSVGPWLMGDFEWGVFAGNNIGQNNENAPIPHSWDFVTGFLKGKDFPKGSPKHKKGQFAIYGGSSQKVANQPSAHLLKKHYQGPRVDRSNEAIFKNRPSELYYAPSRKEGAIVLGTGGDNSRASSGTIYEAAIVEGYPKLSTERKVQAAIVALGYKKAGASKKK
jgi:hypothetical protein